MTTPELRPSAGPQATPYTSDAVLGGQVRFVQPASGYRVNVDSVLLAGFASSGRRAARALDLGAGVGVVALVLHHLGAAQDLTLVERDAAVAACAEQNLLASGVSGRVLVTDLGAATLPAALGRSADLVVSNPPFFEPRAHRAPGHPALRAARQGSLEPFVQAARAALGGARARAVFAYPARSLTELFEAACAVDLVPKRLRLVHAFAARPARLALVELRLARRGGLVVEPPLVEWQAPGVPSAELAELSARRANDRR